VDLLGRGVPAATAQLAKDHEPLRGHALPARVQDLDQIALVLAVGVIRLGSICKSHRQLR
jgi:hypothetical protein